MTTFVLDDDGTFVESFRYRYFRRQGCETETSPERAITRVTENYSYFKSLLPEPVPQEQSQFVNQPGEAVMTLDMSWVDRLASDPRRTQTFGVIFVDYAMPSMDGVEFCRRIQSLPCGKILLTGRAGDDTAVRAFNEGLIDTFLVKNDPALSEKIPKEIERLSRVFFERSTHSLSPLTSRGNGRFLSDTPFMDALALEPEWDSYQEHYLTLSPPGLRVRHANGAASQVIIWDEETMRAQIEVALAEEAPEPLIDLISERTVICNFPTPGGFFTREFEADWKQHVVTAKSITGNEPWWVATRRLSFDA